MQKDSLWKWEKNIIRVLELQEEQVFLIDCVKRTMPKWVDRDVLSGYSKITEQEMQTVTGIVLPEVDSLDYESKHFLYRNYTMIASILPFLSDKEQRNTMISKISIERNLTKKTIRNYLCMYLTYQNLAALAPHSVLFPKKRKKVDKKEVTKDEKNYRYALNKWFYNKNKNSLKTAYTMMLKEKYCDSCGVLLSEYPSFYQFRYFYRKTRKLQTYYISREGLKKYQRNHRPLLGDGVQEYASHVGIGMFDATICDIYLVDDSGNLVGRPIVTACVDAYSSLCMGYSLNWEGGMYSLRGLLLNMIADKKEYCRKFGILIEEAEWDCKELPTEFITDMGSEYVSENFEQIADLGITVVNLPSYRPELKGVIEKFFDLIQDSFKPYLKGKGVIEPDYQERGSHDYRKDACLTMADFEKILLHCIIYYNNKRVIETFPYHDAMLEKKIPPFASAIWKWGKEQKEATLISVNKKELILTLLPRTEGKFSRFGLKVNKMRYHCEGYTEQYLKGGIIIVAYNPDDVSCIWLLEHGNYIKFDLIESRYQGKSLAEVQEMQKSQKEIVKSVVEENLQAKIALAEHIETIAERKKSDKDITIKEIRNHKKREQRKNHRDYVKEGDVFDDNN